MVINKCCATFIYDYRRDYFESIFFNWSILYLDKWGGNIRNLNPFPDVFLFILNGKKLFVK